jgi:osmotically-inducible protein OsmY
MAEDHLRHNPYTEGGKVSCHCESGVLVLQGRLSSYYHKQRAQEAVKELAGVAQVDNRIQVDA